MNSYINTNLPPKLMYRPPGSDTHQDITKVLDDIINKLEDLDNRIKTLESN